MTKRGKILQAASTGPGLVWVDGQQYPFNMGPVWKSGVPPAAGMHVDVEFAEDSTIAAVTVVPDSQIAKEQAEAAIQVVRDKGGAVVSSAIASFGLPLLIATGLLIIGWFFVSAVSMQEVFGKSTLTFWQILGLLNANNALEVLTQGQNGLSAGMYGFAAIVCLAGPFLRFAWKDKRASLGGLLPLAFILIVGIMVRGALNSATGGAAEGPLAEVQRQAQDEMMKAISLGAGTYISLLAALYLAGMGIKQFLASGADSGVTAKPKTVEV